MSRFTTTAICLLAGFLTIGSVHAEAPATGDQVEAAPVPAATPEELAALIAHGRWTIVEFGGEHCIPCKAMQPILQSLRNTLGDKAEIRNFWIQQHPEVARAHRIMVMPTQVVFDPEGREVLRHMGVFPLDEFTAALAEKGLK